MRGRGVLVWMVVGIMMAATGATATATNVAPTHEERCREVTDAALEVFEEWNHNVPVDVAEPEFQKIYNACYVPLSPGTPRGPVPTPDYPPSVTGTVIVTEDSSHALEPVADAYGKLTNRLQDIACEGDCGPLGIPFTVIESTTTCSGGGATLLGFSNTAYVLGTPVHIINEPASSYYEIAFANGDVSGWTGYTRSVANNIEVTDNAAYWDWLHIPMGGSGAWEWRCVGPPGGPYTLTSTSTTAEGTPFGLNILEDVLRVEASGNTCLVPC